MKKSRKHLTKYGLVPYKRTILSNWNLTFWLLKRLKLVTEIPWGVNNHCVKFQSKNKSFYGFWILILIDNNNKDYFHRAILIVWQTPKKVFVRSTHYSSCCEISNNDYSFIKASLLKMSAHFMKNVHFWDDLLAIRHIYMCVQINYGGWCCEIMKECFGIQT